MTLEELRRETRLVVTLDESARALGIGRTLAQQLARAGKYPVPVIRIGRFYKVPTIALRKALGIEPDSAGVRGG